MIRSAFGRFIIAFFFMSATAMSYAQTDTLTDAELIPIFLAISKSDKSHVKEPEIRKDIFIKNFNTIIDIMKKQGFPVLTKDYRRKKIRNCIQNATRSTLIHILQTKPDLLLNNANIHRFKDAIESGKLDKRIMVEALRVYKTDQESGQGVVVPEKMKKYFEKALKEFDIDLQ